MQKPPLTSQITRVIGIIGWDGGRYTRFDMVSPDGAEMHLYVKADEAPVELQAGKTLRLSVS